MNDIYARHLPSQIERLSRYVSESVVPPENVDVDAWAEKSLELSPRVTRFPGPVRFDVTPYTREIVRSFRKSRRTVFVGGAQISKTMCLQTCLGFAIDQDPGPAMVVYPEQFTARRRSRKHLQTLIQDSPALARHIPRGTQLELFEYHLDRMSVNLAWSGSASMLAGEPIRYLFRDEFAKFKGASDKEADALSLSERRTISYGWMARIFDSTTPTLKDSAGWKDLEDGTFEKYNVPCPHCGHTQVLVFGQIRFPSRESGESKTSYRKRVVASTFYECVNCKGQILDTDKPKMLEAGTWVATNPEAPYRSFHLASWYAPWVKFSDVAVRFIDSRNDPEKLRDWLNSDCGEPWEERGENADFNIILAHKLDYAKYHVPTDELFVLILTADVQKDHLWYVVRAHTQNFSYLVDNGTVPNVGDLDDIRLREYLDPRGSPHQIRTLFVDSGYRTTEVYEYCGKTPYAFPVKGEDSQNSPVRWFEQTYYPGTFRKLVTPVHLVSFDTSVFKEELLSTVNAGKDGDKINLELSKWFLHKEIEDDYARQLTAEILIESLDKNNNPRRVWKRVRPDNHYLDCEVYQLGARRIAMPTIIALSAKQAATERKITQQDF